MDKEKLKLFSAIEEKLSRQWNEYLAGICDDKINKDCGTIQIYFPYRKIRALIVLNKDIPTLRNYCVDNRHVWNYIVNQMYGTNQKLVVCDDECEYPAVYDEIACNMKNEIESKWVDIWLDSDYIMLRREVFNGSNI